MSGSAEDRTKLIAATVNRLRMIQMDFADEPDQVRQEQFSKVIDQALKKVDRSGQREFLEDLRDRFPDWNTGPAPVVKEADTSELEQRLSDPHFLADQLSEIYSDLPEKTRKEIVKKLKAGGLVAAGGGGGSELEKALKNLGKYLSLTDDSEGNPETIGKIIGLLLEFALKLDPLVWSTWRKVAPRSEFRHTVDLKQAVSQAARGQTDMAECQAVVERLRFLIAGIISAFGQAGGQFTRYFMAKFSPNQISSLVDMEKGVKIWESKEVRYWRKYIELTSTMTDASIENEIMEQITRYAESLTKGLNR